VGIYDRDYYRPTQRSGFSAHLPGTVVSILIAINVRFGRSINSCPATGEYSLCGASLDAYASFDVVAVSHGRFTHAPPMPARHLAHFGNMVVLFFLGRPVEDVTVRGSSCGSIW